MLHHLTFAMTSMRSYSCNTRRHYKPKFPAEVVKQLQIRTDNFQVLLITFKYLVSVVFKVIHKVVDSHGLPDFSAKSVDIIYCQLIAYALDSVKQVLNFVHTKELIVFLASGRVNDVCLFLYHLLADLFIGHFGEFSKYHLTLQGRSIYGVGYLD